MAVAAEAPLPMAGERDSAARTARRLSTRSCEAEGFGKLLMDKETVRESRVFQQKSFGT